MIRVGPAGSSGYGNIEGIKQIAKSGLTAMEISFTHGVRMSDEMALELGKLSKKLNVALSIHSPYYINLSSKDASKIIASRKRILDSCYKANLMNASPVVFHAGYYQDRDPHDIFNMIEEQINLIQDEIKSNNWKVKIAAETTGKATQFGTLDELIKLKKSTNISYCVDFAHIYARNIGIIDYDEVFKKLKGHIHAHFSGINYGPKGELNHIPLTKPFFNPLMAAIKKYDADITLICEAPDSLGDAIKLKNWLKL